MSVQQHVRTSGGKASVPIVSLSKTIEATKLNKRTGFAESGPDITIPFGGLVEHVSTERGMVRFTYMGEPYRCAEDLWEAAARDSAASAPTRDPGSNSAPLAPANGGLVWEALASARVPLLRTKVPGGWLLATNSGSLTFYPDPTHQWDGKSIP
jgi:hypothetical protein